jgi:hypothetical protein
MLAVDNSNELFRQSYPRSLIVLLYGLVGLAAFLAGYFLVAPLFGTGDGLLITLLAATWSAALAGAIGGTTAMLSQLYQHVSLKQDFQRQSLLVYFVQPLTGLAVGIASLYLVAIPGALIVTFVTDLNVFLADLDWATFWPGLTSLFTGTIANLAETIATSVFVALQILLAWIAGFRQQAGLAKIKPVSQRAISHAAEITPLAGITALDENEPLFFKHWTQQRRLMVRWSFTWGIFLLLYGLIWLVGLLLSYLWAGRETAAASGGGQAALNLILDAWPVAVAGGCGGVFNLFYDLFQHTSVKQDFHRQHLISYLVQPVIGFVFGLIMYFFIATGYLSLSSFGPEDAPQVVDSFTILMTQLALGWIAGFRQQPIAAIILGIVESVISLLKAVLAFFNPATLFDQAKRERQAAAIREARGMTDLFELLDETRSSPAPNQK